MAKSRHFSRNLGRILDRTPTPVYIVSDENRIEYANRACLDWIGLTADELKDARLLYTSDPLDDPVADRIKGICPPPQISDSDSDSFQVYVQRDSTTWWKQAHGRFLRMGQEDYVLVVCADPQNEEASPASETAFDPAALHRELATAADFCAGHYALDNLKGNSPLALSIRRKVSAATGSNIEVFVHGPEGSGREHLARTIFSARTDQSRDKGSPADDPPVVIDCPVADRELIQRSLVAARASKESPGTSLLLLDIDRLRPQAQNELLGFLRMPDSRFQIISTSGIAGEQLNLQTFDQELLARINTMTIELVPLKDRVEDIPLIAQAFVEQFNRLPGNETRQRGGFSESAMQALMEFDWPRNIDQLSSTVTAAAMNARDQLIGKQDLPDAIVNAESARDLQKPVVNKIDLVQYLEGIEQQLIARAMQQAGGNKSQACRLLGISRPKLLRRLQATGLVDSGPAADDFVDPSAFEEADE